MNHLPEELWQSSVLGTHVEGIEIPCPERSSCHFLPEISLDEVPVSSSNALLHRLIPSSVSVSITMSPIQSIVFSNSFFALSICHKRLFNCSCLTRSSALFFCSAYSVFFRAVISSITA